MVTIPGVAFSQQTLDVSSQPPDSVNSRERLVALSAGLTIIESNNGVSIGWAMGGQFSGPWFGAVDVEIGMGTSGTNSPVAMALVPELVIVIGGQQANVRGLLALGGGAGFNSEVPSDKFLSPVAKASFGLAIMLNSKSTSGLFLEGGALGYLGEYTTTLPFVRFGLLL